MRNGAVHFGLCWLADSASENDGRRRRRRRIAVGVYIAYIQPACYV